ncbi:lysophosphatidic acid receptor 6-like [Heterodontus francisci]|uniref:lysophosphatidic acid receptor 6-like n=1 Tax=Heterodontus francisci TaxID=7792 RepID=UPI00355C6485
MNQTLADAMNCTSSRMLNAVDDSVKRFQAIVNLPTFILGLFLNGIALWILCFKLQKRTESTIYMTNLIVSDILLLFSLPFKIYAYQIGEWSLSPRFCNLLESLYYVNTYASILIITLICMDRYIAIKHPFLARTFRSPKKTGIACAVVWIVVSSCSIYIYSKKTSKNCFFNHSASVWKVTTVALLQTIFLVTALIMIFCSIQIIRTLQRSGALKSGNRSSSKSMKIVLSNLLVFLVCFTPYHVGILMYFLARNCWILDSYVVRLRNFLQICLCLANINCVLDAIYYYFVIKEFWKSNTNSQKTGA